MASTNERYDELLAKWRKATLLASCSSQLSWDEQTYLPPGGAAHRADQLSLLAGMVHEQLTAPRLGELISDLERDGDLGEADGPRRANLREARRRYDRDEGADETRGGDFAGHVTGIAQLGRGPKKIQI